MAGNRTSIKSFSLILTVLWVASLMAVAAPGAVATDGAVGASGPFPVSLTANEDATDGPAVPVRDGDSAAAAWGVPDATGRVTVEIVHTRGVDSAAGEQVARLYGEVLGSSPGVTLVRVPVADVPALQLRSDVEYVRSPLRVDLLPDPIQASGAVEAASDVHVTVTNAAAWLDAGQRGDGIKVGIVDFFDGAKWSAAQSAGELPPAAGTFCRSGGASCDLWNTGSSHGVGVAEVIHDMAPGASLYVATAVTVTDLAAAVEWFDAQGVQIISRSLSSVMDGPGDGTGSVDAVVDDAVSRGMIWLNSAGNKASASGTANGSYWRGSWTDANANSWLEFAPGDEELGFYCGFIQGVRWSDWDPTGRTDYDVVIADAGTGDVVATLVADQTQGAPPLELIASGIDCSAHPVLMLLIHLYDAGSGTSGDTLEFMANQSEFEYSSNPYSVTQPASDSANPGALSVGAIDPAAGGVIASYSSQGPTNDARIKPDVTAPSCLPSYTYSPGCFNGTSAATPVVAGAAALVWGAGVATTPTTVADYMRNHVIDRGAPGADPIYGTGQLYLGDPPSSGGNMAPVVSAGTDQTVTLPSTAALDGTVNDDGLPSGSLAATWTMQSGPGSVTFGDASAVDTTATFSTHGSYVLRLTATDGALSNYDEVAITVNPIPDFFSDDEDSVFEKDVNWMAAVGITQGCNPPINDRYCADAHVTRGQMAAFLVRALHLTARLPNPFIDDDGSVFEADIERLAAAGITAGCNPPTNNRFCPNGKVTREQMAAFLVRALNYTDDGGGDLFVDDDNSIFEADIDRLGTAGVTAGCNPPANTQFCPTGNVTRGQMAAFLHRAVG